MLKIIEGDLLEIPVGSLLHQVNCRGATGGLAGALRRKYHSAFNRYIDMCDQAAFMGESKSLLGVFCSSEADRNLPHLSIVHIFGQLNPGPNTDMDAVDGALEAYAEWRTNRNDELPVYAPYQMGCRLGGGDWSKYSAIIEKHLPTCIIVRKYEPLQVHHQAPARRAH